jgi:hypothetical protein
MRTLAASLTLAVILLLLGGSTASLEAQSVSIYSTVVGTVTDTSGAAVPDGQVTVTNLATNISVSTKTDSQGLYRIERLVLGSYRIVVTHSGFQATTNENVSLSSAQTIRVDVSLKVGQVEQSFTVEGGTSLINTENAQLSNSFEWDSRKYLPTSSPNFYDLLALQPATVSSSPTYMVSFAGSLQNQYDYQINGMSFRGGYGGHGVQGNYNEWMQEQNSTYVDNGAEYQTLAVNNVTSKSGSNVFHGSAVDYYTSGGLQGRSPFSLIAPSTVQNVYAGSIGGPIRKDRTFFYAAYSGTRSPGVSSLNATVPSQAMQQGNFSAFSTPLIDPSTGQPFPGSQIPQNRTSSVASAFDQRFYPAPNYGGGGFLAGNYRFYEPTFSEAYDVFGRVDERISDKHSLFVDYTIDDSACGVDICFTGSLPTVGFRLGYRRDQNAGFSDLYTFSPTLYNEFGGGWTRDLNTIQGQVDGTSLLQTLGLQGITPVPTPGIPSMSIQGITTVTQQSLYKTPNSLFSLRDTLSWVHGHHSAKFGVSVAQARYVQYPTEPDPVFGSFTFSSALAGGTGNAFGNFLLGIPSSESRQLEFNSDHYQRKTYQFFAQDSIEVTRNLTVNIGLRYEYYQPFQELDNQAYTTNLATGALIVPNQQSLGLISPLIAQSPSFQIQTTAQAGYPPTIYSLSEKNFAPRLGAAYRLADKTVVRGGYGIYYDFIPPQFTPVDLYLGTESFPNNTITNGVPAYSFPNPFAINPLPVGTLSVSSFAKNLRMPYTQQWNLTVEHQFGTATSLRASYIGSHTVEQLYSATANIPEPSTTVFAQSRRPLMQFGPITYYQNGADASYNGISFQFQHRTHSGIYVNSSYTFAKDLGIAGETSSSQVPSILDPFNRQLDYGPVMWAPTQQSVTVINYPLPVGHGRKFFSALPAAAQAVVGGWTFTSIFTARTGDHLTPTYSGYDSTGTGILTGRPDLVGNPNFSGAQQTAQHWFNAAAFTFPGASLSAPLTPPSGPIGRFGTAGVGIITGPGVWQEDMGLAKQFSIVERLHANIFLLATNVFNHPNLGDPTVDITQPTLTGTILSLRSDPNASGIGMRVLQVGLRLEF